MAAPNQKTPLANMRARLSPGPELLHQWMDAQQKDTESLSSLAMYNVFPAFPTSFIVACNTEVEVSISHTDLSVSSK
jgi:hypothetical protein